MTVLADDTIEQYEIDGEGPYAFSFRIFSETDLSVSVLTDASPAISTPLYLNSHYIVTGVNDQDGGVVSLLTATATLYDGYTLDIRSNTPNEQPTSIRNQARFLPEIHEDAFDYLSRQIQDLRRLVTASIRYPDTGMTDGELSPIANWYGRYLYVNPSGVVEPSASIANTVLTQGLIAGLMFPQSAAEGIAGVTPSSSVYQADPVSDVRRYGWSAANSAAANAVAIATAISALPRVSGLPSGTVVLPAGAFNCDPFTIPQFVTVRGAGQRATQLTYAGSSTFISLGGTSNTGVLKYGCKICDCAIILTHKDSEGVRLRETASGQVSWMYIEGAITASRTNRGVVIDGGDGSSFFNRIDNVICNHMENSYRLLTSGAQRSTCTMFSNCSALGDVASVGTASKGLTIDGSQGDGSVWTGGNFEACGTAVYYANGALSTSMYGARFEGNTLDFNGVNGCFAQSIVGIQTEVEFSVTDPGLMLKFDNCTLLGGAHWKRVTLGGPTGVKSRIIQGTGTFSASGSVTVTIGETLPNSVFNVIAIDNTGATSGIRYRHNKGSNTTTTFSISADTSTSNSFSWILIQ